MESPTSESELFPPNAIVRRTLSTEVHPLKTLEQLLEWTPSADTKFKTEALALRVSSVGPRLLVCHDMKGGYLDDRFVYGSGSQENYRFFHWNYVDTFVYFSHHLVTIPPVGWITAAHRHGVRVLGTLITEWEKGYQVCESLLSCPQKMELFVEKLSQICKHFTFDGWLVNIENKLQAEMVPKMRDLLGSLKRALAASVPGSQVIWYDSIISTGELKWQNELNQHNRLFFDVCDGIFLNYNWTEEHLTRSLALAADRVHDVYVGVDVFGRGCLGGGGFNTCEAVEVAGRFGLSVAMFAPGWVMEVHGWKDFLHNQHRFWNMLSQFFGSKRQCGLPVRTSFCQGFGVRTFSKGKCLYEGGWFNLSKQELQPTFESHEKQTEEKEGTEEGERECHHCQTSVFTEEAFNGGGCLKITGSLTAASPTQYFKLFGVEVAMPDSCSVLAALTWKFLPGSEAEVGLQLQLRNSQGEPLSCLLSCCSTSSRGLGPPDTGLEDGVGQPAVDFVQAPLTQREVQELGLGHLLDHCPSWTTRMFLLSEKDFANHLMTEIGVQVSSTKQHLPQSFSLLLGELQVIPLSGLSKKEEPPPVTG